MLPHNVAMVDKYRKEPFAVVGVNSDARGRSGLAEIVKEHELNYPSAVDGAELEKIENDYHVVTHPTTFLVNKKGLICAKFEGYVEPARLTEAVERLLREP
jgi:peroxiredoxin